MTSASAAAATPGGCVDLHAHSTASDGSAAPAQVVARAAALGLRAIALTDHDTVAGIPDARAAAATAGIRFVAGVELSAVEGEVETHILGLHLQDLGAMQSALDGLRAMRRRRAETIVERLRVAGAPVTLDAVLAHAAGGVIGRPHVARALIDARHVADFREAFDRYLGAGRPAYVAKDALPVRDAIAMIHAAGGLAVLAHPGSGGTLERVRAHVDAGLDGLEVAHPGHGREDTVRLDSLATHFRLVRSGGSDWHGAIDGQRVLGCMKVPEAWLAEQDARLAAGPSRERVA